MSSAAKDVKLDSDLIEGKQRVSVHSRCYCTLKQERLKDSSVKQSYFYVYVTTGTLKRLHISLVLQLINLVAAFAEDVCPAQYRADVEKYVKSATVGSGWKHEHNLQFNYCRTNSSHLLCKAAASVFLYPPCKREGGKAERREGA